MPLIEAALAFAITMLALSLIVSSFVEIIHRMFKMREAGLKYMLEELFDQVLAKYAQPLVDKATAEATKARDDLNAELTAASTASPVDAKTVNQLKARLAAANAAVAAMSTREGAYKSVRDAFVERMRTNRVPVGLK